MSAPVSPAVASPDQLMSRTFLAGAMRLGDAALLLLFVLAARWLGSAPFGLFVFGLTLASVIVIPVLEAFMPVVAKRAARQRECVGDDLGAILPLQAALWLGLLVLTAAGLSLFRVETLHRQAVLVMLGAVAMRGPLEVVRAGLRGLGRLDMELVVVGVERTILLLAGVSVLLAGGGPLLLGACFIGARIVAVAVGLHQLHRLGHPVRWGLQGWPAMLQEAWPYSLTIGVITAYGSAGILLLSWLAGDAATGAYGAVYRIYEGAISLPQVLVLVLLPELAARHGAAPNTVAPLLRKATRYAALLALPLTAVLLAEGAWLVNHMLGNSYELATGPLYLLGAGLLWAFGAEIARTALWALDRQGLALGALAAGLVLNVALTLWLVPRLGAVGAAAAAVVSTGLIWGWFWSALSRIGLPWSWRDAGLKPLGVGLAVFLTLRGLHAAPWPLRFAAGALAALGAVGLTKAVSPMEWQLVRARVCRCLPGGLGRRWAQQTTSE